MTIEEFEAKANKFVEKRNSSVMSNKATNTAVKSKADELREFEEKANRFIEKRNAIATQSNIPATTKTITPVQSQKETIADKMNQLWVEDTPQNNNISYKPASVKDFVNSIKDEVPQPAQKTPVLSSNNTYKPVNVKDFVDSINNKAVVEAGYDPNSFSLKEKALLNSGNYSVNPNYDPKNKYSKKVIYTGNVLTNKDVDPTLGQKLSNAAERTGRTAMDLVGNVATGITQAGEGLVDAGVANTGDFLSNLTSVGGLLPNKVSEGIRQGSENFVKYGLASDMKKMIDEDSKKGSGIYKPSILGIDVRDIAQEGARMITLSPLGMAGFMASAAGSSTEEALNEGEKLRNAVTYGNIAGAIEGATEKMFDTFGIIGGGKFDKFLPKSVMGRFIAGGIGEGIEEGVSGAINPFIKMLTYEGKVENPFGSKENFNNYLGDLGQQMLAGMVTGWAMQGASDISSSNIRNQFRREVSNAVNKLPVESNVKSNIADKILGGANRLTNAQIDNGIKAYKSYINEYMTKNIKSTIQSQNVQGLIKNSLREKLQNVQNNTAKDLIPGIIKAPQNANMNAGTQNTIKQQITNIINNNTQLTTDEKQGLLQILEENSNNLTPDAVNFFNDTINNLQSNRLEQVTTTEDKKAAYKKYLNDKTELDKTALETAKNSVPANKSGRRTKEQWLKVANTIGQQIYDLSDAEIERYAYKSWQETHPNQAGNLNRQGKGFVKFTSDEWIDAVTRSAQQAKAQTKSNNKLSTQKKTVINSENIFKQITNNTNAKVYNDLLIDNKLGSISKEKLSDITKRYNTFSEKHNSDFNENNKHKNSNVNSEYYYIDNNWIKLTTTQEGNNLFIDELYVENPGQGIGSKIVELLKDYADKKGLQLDTAKELKSAEGFWNKTLRGKTKQELSTESEQISKLPVQKNIENEQTMRYNKNIENMFANVKAGEILNVPTKSLLPLLNGGGYRTEEQISNLRNIMLKDGVPGNIKVYRGDNGQIELEDGNHRIQIANELGIKNLPVEMISRWSDVLPENNNLDIQNEIKEVIYNDRASNPNSNTNEESRSKSRSLPEGYVVAKDRGTTDENAKISGRKSYDNESRSNVENERNNRQIEDSNKSSFSMSENSLDYQGKNLGSGKAEGKNITADKASGKINDFLSKYTAVYDKNMKETLDQLIQVKNKPNAEIKIYRASPSDSINSGDWVYLSKAQAEKWTKTHFGTTKPGYKVTEKTVKASDVDWTGKNLDFVYKPENIATSQNKLEAQADKSSKLDYISPVENIDKASDFVNNATEKDIETLEKMVKEAEKYPYRIDLQFFAEKAREKLRYLTKSQKYRNSKINAIANEIAIDYNMDKRDITAALSEYAKDYANNGKSIKDIDKFAKRIGITNNNYLEDKLNNLRNSLDLAERYDTERLNDKAKQEMEKQEYKLNTDTVSKLYELKQQYQKDYEKVDNKLMLTKLDRVQLDRLIKGEITEAELPENSNKSEILEAYKSKKRLQDVTDEIKRYNKAVKHKRMSDMRELVANSSKWKDKKTGLQYGRETQERNIMDIAPESDAKAIIKKVFDPIHHNEAEATKYKNSLRNEVRKLDLNSKKEYEVTYKDDQGTKTEKVSERGLVQLYGEKKITDSILDEIKAPKDKIKQSVETFRNIYNGLYEKINKVRVENGYAPIDFRKDYFPHFEETKADGMIGKALQKLGLLVDTSELPTDIAGLTHMRRPGTKWVSNFLKRTSDITVYDAIEGFDSYLDNVADVIYHTDDIQKLRAYENAIRYQHSDENVKKQIDDILDMEIADEEKASLIDQTYSNAENNLSHYVQDIRAYTDTLAGKKSLSDREIERDLGRGIYNITKAVQGKVSANMVGANLSSALTNIIPLTQATSVIKMPNLLSAIYDTAKSTIKSDGFAEKSDFIVNRRGSERLNKTVTDKMADATNVMGLIDDVVSETVTRGKYYQNIKEGMEENEAIDNANKFAAGLLADRSKGSMPTMFNKNNPMMKLLTAFQLEVNNQWSYMFKDIPREYKDKFVGKIVWGFAKMFIGAYIYNEIYEKWTGRRSALDPIDWVKDVYTGISKGDSSFNIGTKLVSNVSEQVPFISGLINGGRLPISNALPSVSNTYKAVTELADTSKRGRAAKTLAKEFSKPLFYIVPPFGGGQIKKTAEGLITYVKGGEYGVDSDGNKILKFPVERTPGNLLKSLLFGKYSTEGAKRYVDSNFKTLSVSQTKGYEAAKKAGVKPDDFYKVYEAQKGIEGVKDKNGKTIPLSASQNKKKAIDELIPGYTKKQKEILYEAFGISKQVWEDAYKK